MTRGSRGNLRREDQVPVARISPDPDMTDLVRWYWCPEWRLDDGETFEARTLPYPSCQLVVEDGHLRVYGPVTRGWTRTLRGHGWALGASLTPGAARAVAGDVSAMADTRRDLPAPELLDRITFAMQGMGDDRHATAARLLGEWLREHLGERVRRDPDADRASQLLTLADDDTVLDVGALAQRMSVSERTLQRLARTYIGMSPAAMIRRRRLQEAAMRVRDHDADLTEIAAELGYADHAHLTRDFTRVLGLTPSAFRRTDR